MKKWFLSTLFVLSLAGCNETDDLISIDTLGTTSPKRSQLRSYEEAKFIALQSISILDSDYDNSVTTRGISSSRTLQDKATYVVCADPCETRLSESFDNDTLMYVFNFENNQGFAIVSASLQTEPLLAVTEEGYYDPSVDCDNKSFSSFMELTKQYVLCGGGNANKEERNSINRGLQLPWTLYATVGKYITVKRGQLDPEGIYCPNGICGCAITAMAMVMSYYNYPSTININHDNYDIPNYTLNWSAMKMHVVDHNQDYFECEASNDAHDMISHLCRQLGVTAGSTYNVSSTSTTTTGLRNCLINYGYTVPGYSDFSESDIVWALNNQRPVLMFGQTSSYIGHFWIVDGYKSYYPTGVTPPGNGGLSYNSSFKYYNHVNWGWNGDCNGYFLSGVFNTQVAYTYDGFSTHQSNYSFINGLQYIIPYI